MCFYYKEVKFIKSIFSVVLKADFIDKPLKVNRLFFTVAAFANA